MGFNNNRALMPLITCALCLSASPVSMAANNIVIESNSDTGNTNIDELSVGAFTSNADSAILKFESIHSAWSLNQAVTIETKELGTNNESGTITLDATLDFNSYNSSSLTFNALADINLNADISDSDTNTADSLTLTLAPATTVNLNATIGQFTNTTVNGALAIGDSGIYNLINASDSLSADSISKTTLGTFNYSAGSLSINSLLNIEDSGVLGSAFNLNSDQVLHTASMSVGTLDPTSGSFTQNGGSNTVDGVLAINAGGNYALNTGSLTASDITRATDGVFSYNGGDLTISSGTLAIEEDGLLGATTSINASHNLHTVNQTIGTADALSGSFTQDGGTNTVDGTLTVNAGGDYALNAGTLVASNIVNDGAMNVAGALSVADGNSYIQSGNLTANDINADGVLTQNDGTTVTNAINVGGTGNYTLNGGSLQSGSVSVDGTVNQVSGDHTNTGALTINTTGAYNLSGGTLTTNSLSTDGVFTQSGGSNSVATALTVDTNGTYNMNGGNLKASSVTNNGTFVYTGGGVLLTNSAMNINSTEFLGNAVTIETGDIFGATSMTVGDGALNGGTVIQNAGINTITNALTISNNGSYTINGGNLNTGSLLIQDGGTFAGAGTVTAVGDITDLRTSGVIDASYTGTNISLEADTMTGAINASESLTLDSITVSGAVTGTAMTLSGGTELAGDVNLTPYVLNTFYDYSVVNSISGDNTISGNISITPLEVDRFLSIETVDSASIDVAADSLVITGDVNASLMDMSLNVASGSSLSVQGNSTSTKELYADVAAGGSLLLGNTTASRFEVNGNGSFNVNGALTTSGAGALGNVDIQSGSLSVTGTNGAITADGSTIVVGKNTSSINSGAINTAQLQIDNSVAANSNRIGDATDIQLSTGSIFTFIGHATGTVLEKAGSLIVEHINQSYTGIRDFVSNVVVNGGSGTTELTFDDLQIVAATGVEVNRIDFATNGSFGNNERILFNATPALSNGLMQNATINSEEFVTYDNSLGIKSATTATNSFVAAGNIFVNSDTGHSGSTTINSLAATTANVTGTGEISVSSGQMLLSGTSVINPSINFNASEGYALVTGNSTLAGGVNGTNGMFINGGGTLNLAGAGTMTGTVTVNSGNLVLSADNALQGSDITVYDSLAIGSTTQNINSLSTGSGFSGTGSVIANNDISYTSSSGTVNANFESLDGNVTVRADVMNGDINANSLDSLKGIVRLGDTSYPYASTTMNGNTVASVVRARGTVNGNIDASDSILLYGTSNGVISGATELTGSATLRGFNTYTGSTSGTFTLREGGSIASSSEFTGSLSMYSNDGESNLNRVGDTAQINLNSTGNSLNLVGSGSDASGIAISENVGTINVAAGSEVNINIANSLNGSTTLSSDALVLGSGALAFLSLGDSSQLKFDAAPATIATDVIAGVYIDKEINGSTMQTWTTYDATNGVVEVSVAESSITSAASGDFIRVTDAVNSPLTADHTIGAMTVDTTQTMSGAGVLTVGSGQIQFWQDNTIDINQINFDGKQAFLSNAGTNTINSDLNNSNGLRKLGDGKIILGGTNTYTGNTLISAGELEVTGSLASGVIVSSGTGLTINGGQVTTILSNDGNVNLINASHSNLVGNNLDGYGNFNMDSASSLTNHGGMDQYIENNGGAIDNSNTGYIYRVINNAGSTLTNSGDISYVNNNTGASFTHSSGTVGRLTNSGVYSGTVNSVIGTVNNESSFTNNGTINNDITNYGTFINNSNITLEGFNTSHTSADTLRNNAGTFTNNADKIITVKEEADINIVSGSFNNDGTLTILNAVNNQTISGSFINNTDGTTTVTGSTLNLNGTFTNKGSVNIDATSLVTGSGTYLQQNNIAATTVVNGRVETNVEINSGDLSGVGQIAGDLIIGPNGTLRPGESPGLMTIEGDFNLSGILDLEVMFDLSGTMQFDQLAIGGDFNIFGNGRVNFDLGLGIDESIFTGETPDLLLTDIFSSLDESDPLSLSSLLDTSLNISLADGNKFKLSLLQDESGAFSTSVEAVPVPAAVWLFGSGLLSLIAVARRRSAC